MKTLLEGLKTERLYFTALSMDCLNDLLPFFSSREAMKYMDSPDDPQVYGAIWITRQMDRYNNHGMGLMAIKALEDDQLTGMCGLTKQKVAGKEELEIGYHLIPKFWGNGYATEAAKAVKHHVFKNNLSDSIISIIHIDNKPSQAVAIRNGMALDFESTFKGFPVKIYRISKKDWTVQE